MFIGIDHGTTAMRFASGSGEFKISREEATSFSFSDISGLCPISEIEGIALGYSMGDNFSKITSIHKVKNRGLLSRDGAGKHIGGGTRVFDEVKTISLTPENRIASRTLKVACMLFLNGPSGESALCRTSGSAARW